MRVSIFVAVLLGFALTTVGLAGTAAADVFIAYDANDDGQCTEDEEAQVPSPLGTWVCIGSGGDCVQGRQGVPIQWPSGLERAFCDATEDL